MLKAEVYTVATLLLYMADWKPRPLFGCAACSAPPRVPGNSFNPMGTYYETLGIPRDASPERIRHAHRSLAKVWHPDKFHGRSVAEAEAGRRIREINAAYTVLSNARARASYDAKLEAASPVLSAAYPIPEHCSQCRKPTTYWVTAAEKTRRLCYACGGVRQ
jgi:hypothetical protein